MTRDEIVVATMVAIRAELSLNERLPAEACLQLRKEGEALAEEIEQFDPVAQEIVIRLRAKLGLGQLDQGHFDVLAGEAKKVVDALRKPLAADKKAADQQVDEETQKLRQSIVEATVVALRAAQPWNARLPADYALDLRKQGEWLASKISDMEPVAVQIIIALCAKKGQVPIDDGMFDIFKAEAQKVVDALHHKATTKKGL